MLDSPLMWKHLITRLSLLWVILLNRRGWSVGSGGLGLPCEETSRRISTPSPSLQLPDSAHGTQKRDSSDGTIMN